MTCRVVVALLALGLLVAVPAAHAVNLVPNDSFESFNSCPVSFSNTADCVSWIAPTNGTSDYYNACATSVLAPDVPTNNFGFQNARTGDAYCGFIVHSSSEEYREYIEVQLTSPLVANTTYLVKFYVSLSDIVDSAVDRLGAYFSVGSVAPVGNWLALPYTPQVESPANVFLTDQTNWMLVSGTFVAAGGETHMVIGSFRDNATQNLMPMSGSWPGANYHIDDVSVEAQPAAVDQACCLGGSCTLLTPAECQTLGGTPYAATSCDPDPCSPVPARPASWGALKTIYR